MKSVRSIKSCDVMWKPFFAIMLLVCVLASVARADLPANQPTTSPSTKFEKEIVAYEATDKTAPPPRGAILFIGSSTIRLWKSLATDYPEYDVINRGFGGSEIADSVYYADRIVIPYQPRLIVLNAGSNDISAGKSPEQVFADFKAFVGKVRAALPNVRIAYLAIQPAPVRWKQADKQREVNRLVREFTQSGDNMDYIEVWDQLLGADGTPDPKLYLADGLHGNDAAYKIRAAVVRPHLIGPKKQ